MPAMSEQMQNDLLTISDLQRRIRQLAVSSSSYEPLMRNLLEKLGEFIAKHRPTSYTISVGAEGQPNASFTWSSGDTFNSTASF